MTNNTDKRKEMVCDYMRRGNMRCMCCDEFLEEDDNDCMCKKCRRGAGIIKFETGFEYDSGESFNYNDFQIDTTIY